ncbi:tyrosine-type recombinase/integrase [Sutcliffiella sp. NPDC057660]|uniref:tyrosine-type recombinase/integrase n=1 Tax=Sutcliffiella sp. NPDC057660 TaxID=3346199 RepID=UPI0036A24EB8
MPYDFRKYLTEQGYKEPTMVSYTSTVESFFAYLTATYKRNKELHEINPSDIKGFINSKVIEANSIHTINKHIAILKTFFDYLWKVGKLPIDPAVKIRRLKNNDPGPKDIEYNRLLEIRPQIINDNRYNLITKSIFVLALKGLRFSEFHFTKKDVTYAANGIIQIKIETRNNKNRVVNLSGKDAEIFDAFFTDCQFNPGDYVFTTKRQQTNEFVPIEIDSMYTYLKNIRNDYELPRRFKLDDIRIAYAYYLRTNQHYMIDQIAEEFGIEKMRAAELSKLAIERYGT